MMCKMIYKRKDPQLLKSNPFKNLTPQDYLLKKVKIAT